jgi:hypothetical protein
MEGLNIDIDYEKPEKSITPAKPVGKVSKQDIQAQVNASSRKSARFVVVGQKMI